VKSFLFRLYPYFSYRVVCLFLINFRSTSYTLDTSPSSDTCIANRFSHSEAWPFTLNHTFWWMEKMFYIVQFINFFLWVMLLLLYLRKLCLTKIIRSVFYLSTSKTNDAYFYRQCYALSFAFMSMIHFRLIFVRAVEEASASINYRWMSSCLCAIFEQNLLSPTELSWQSYQKSSDHKREDFSRLSILFHWSIGLSLCQYHTAFITAALY